MRIKPYECWRLAHYLDVKDGEPTDYAIESIKGRGIGGIIVGFVLLFLL